MSNTQEQSLFESKGLTPEEIEALSDEQILEMMIREKRTRLAADTAQRGVGIRRRRRAVAAPTTRSK